MMKTITTKFNIMNLSITSGEDLFQIILLVVIILFALILLGVVVSIYNTAQMILHKKMDVEYTPFSFDKFWKSVKGEKPMEMEAELMLDHDYDGIKELDNHLPPWWIGLFYACIAFAVVYLLNYQVYHWSPSQEEEYEIAMAEAAEQKALTQANRPEDALDEAAIPFIEDETQLARGKTIYDGNCSVCHGSLGEGGVGPNLADEYWIHGGSMSAIFQTVKYGVPEKGMISWEATLKPLDIQQVSSYIYDLKGTNPPNGKEPQGEAYQEEEIAEL
ncbi:MAG: cytochrome c oxidase cbb3-type subunit 3 [Arcticibacterium sp.]|jgi:cytochrome c oxidase cbb3-type subunit 3